MKVADRVTNTSLKWRFVAGTIMYLVVTISLATYALTVNQRQNDGLDWASEMFVAYESLQTAQSEYQNARRGGRTYLLYGDEVGLQQYQVSTAAYEQQLANAGAIIGSLVPAGSPILGELEDVSSAIEAWETNDLLPSLQLRQEWTGDEEELQSATIEWAQSDENRVYFDNVLSAFSRVIASSRLELVEHVEDVGEQNTTLTRTLISTLLLMTSFAIIGCVFLYREITRPLDRLAGAARGIEEGDFSRRSGVLARNEIGIAAAAFDSMAERVEHLVSDLQTARREIAARESRIRSVLDAANDAMIYIDPSDRITMVNRCIQQRFGIADTDLLGRSVDEAATRLKGVFTDVSPFIEAVDQPFADDERTKVASLEQYWPVEREYALSVLPVTDDAGNASGKLCVMRDVSAERAADRMKSDFVALVSHELRTPLTSIKGYVELMLEEEFGDVPAEQKDVLGIVSDSAQRLVTLTNDLLDISRIEAGRLDLRPASMHPAAVVEQIVESLQPQIKAKSQVLTVDLPADLPEIMADRSRFAQVVTNLISNAHKYTPAGGLIRVRARQTGAMVRFEVEDTGVGLSEDEQAKLFSRFYRVQNRLTQAESGTGLGLAIARSLVEAQGGSIGVTSEPGVGSCFFFTLPVSATGDGAASDASSGDRATDVRSLAGAAARGSARRILVVEDEREIAALIELYLRRGGYQTRATGSASEAIELAASWRPDLITLDVILADGDGFAVLEALRKSPVTAAIPVLFISMMPGQDRERSLGAIDHLSKPINERHLIDRIGRVLGDDRKRDILIVDDDAATRGFLRERLTRLGYNVVEAIHGADAIERMTGASIALALIDVNMPVLNGVETLRQMRERPDLATIPVIMMTAGPSTSDANATTIEQLGAILLTGKDLTAEELAGAIAAHILPSTAETVDEEEPAGEEAPTGPTVLIADDDPNINELLQRRLRRRGLRVLTAPNGRLALDIIEREPVDLVFLDIAMPVMDGFDVLDAIRGSERDIIVIMSTAFGSEATAEEAMRRGADYFVAKPYEQDALNVVLDRALERLSMGEGEAAVGRTSAVQAD